MIRTMKIKGMMCSHCENHVKKALEELNGVEACRSERRERNGSCDIDKRYSR